MRTYAPLLGYVYVPLGVLALALGTNHPQAASALFVGAAFALLWFLGSLHARIIRYDPDGFFASHRRARRRRAARAPGGRARLARRARRGAVRGLRRDGDHRLLARRRSRARKVSKWFGRAGIAGGVAVLLLGVCEAAADWTFVGSTFWASSLGFMIWVLVTATYLVRS